MALCVYQPNVGGLDESVYVHFKVNSSRYINWPTLKIGRANTTYPTARFQSLRSELRNRDDIPLLQAGKSSYKLVWMESTSSCNSLIGYFCSLV
jgi:hypothetical protein